jgi:hypothetical protein
MKLSGCDQDDQEVQDRDGGRPDSNSARNSDHVFGSASKHHPYLRRFYSLTLN